MIQLTYGFHLSLTDTARANQSYAFTVRPWHAQPDGAPAIEGLRVWASYDDGRHWTPAPVVRQQDGSYQVLVMHPALGKTSGTVSIRAEAWDGDGNRVVQQIDGAYGLTAGPVQIGGRALIE